MKCYFRSFDASIGDCNIIRLVKDDGRQYVIMVDCGMYTKTLKEYLQTTLHNRIDLLIATHIDGDHIQGITSMLKNHEGLSVGEIWYNCYRRNKNVEQIELSDQQKAILEQIQKAMPVEFDAINYREVSAPQGKTLAKTILDNPELKAVWKIEYITYDSEDFVIPGGFGKIVFLAPRQESLEAIDSQFKDEFNKYFMQVWKEGIANSEELQELLIRFVDAFKDKYVSKQISAKKEIVYDASFVKKQANEEDTDGSDTNYSSIAFMIECGEHKIAMLGDSFASTIEKAIDNKYVDFAKPIECDAIKVSHHGSNGNSSKSLFERINSHKYFIPGGKGEKYPSWGTLGRIAETCKDEEDKLIVFSHSCAITQKMNELGDEDKRKLGIKTIITEEEYELFEW